MMDIIGKTTIHPLLFYSGKISGYITWIVLFLLLLKFNIVEINLFVFHDYISIVLLIIGLIFIVLSLFNLGSSTRLGLPTEKTVFKTTGLYKISRNPMYLGFNLLTISSIIYTFNILIVLAGIYSIVVYHLIILAEEKFLENRFGFEYASYKEKVRRYL